ncbi:MAG: hypothetical protein R2826_11180 [Thermoleophilia bacterium]
MNLPPAIVDLSVAPRTGRHIRLWLPLFLLWPLLLVLGLLGLALATVADVILVLTGRRFHHFTGLLLRAFAALVASRGTAINVSTATSAVAVTVK